MGQIEWVAALRGTAVLLVFASHQYWGIEDDGLNQVLGRSGVAIFLLMAGYLSCISVQKKTTGQYIWNRFLRLYPVYWLLMTMVFFLSHAFSITEYFKNLTLFQEYLGARHILHHSWMLSIVIMLYGMILIMKKDLKRWVPIAFMVCATGSLGFAILRFFTGLHFPTAIFLLLQEGLLGCMIQQNCGLSKKPRIYLLVFEITLIISTLLSYPLALAIEYIIAYNIGIALFVLFMDKNICSIVLKWIGTLGFTMFLGDIIPVVVINRIVPAMRHLPIAPTILYHFIAAILFSYIITKFIEQPLLKWGKRIV